MTVADSLNMPPTFSLSVGAKILLENRRTDVPLGPFDGRVAALHPRHSDFYIATPNQEDLFSPPGPCNMITRNGLNHFPTQHHTSAAFPNLKDKRQRIQSCGGIPPIEILSQRYATDGILVSDSCLIKNYDRWSNLANG
ncbi:hypothetical protein F5887DRAFT_919173 [Amanita rubescens]|nr:hypothetical protein F5887DRAFT_923745 [Amanita rubescens]KAF8334580.1 hypothetical protein F5887DRAFT_921449 [Amanita rubescens]KAF8337776.1 hypothetical protein F5887DRAFT_920276 [Amanita rubescens]KAF8341058.1 hypothetical protein F5887DRAFT_919173 [Amanita rubescens]